MLAISLMSVDLHIDCRRNRIGFLCLTLIVLGVIAAAEGTSVGTPVNSPGGATALEIGE